MVRLLDLRETARQIASMVRPMAQLWPLAPAIGPPVQCGMAATANLVEVAALIGDTARATMLAALMGGRRYQHELAHLARVSRPTASEHLTKLQSAAAHGDQAPPQPLLRHCLTARAAMLEGIKAVAAIEVPPRHQPRSTQDDALRLARTCYDHVAGRLGVTSPTRSSESATSC